LIYRNPKSKPPARISRYNLRLIDLEFDIQHKPGKENIADFLSRHPLELEGTNRETFFAEHYIYFIGEQNAPRALRIDKIMEETSKDKTLIFIIKAIKSNDFSNKIIYINICRLKMSFQCNKINKYYVDQEYSYEKVFNQEQ
jgi:hypothetical protein